MSSRRFKVFAPLQNFCWAGDNFEIAPEIWIRRFEHFPAEHEILDTYLSYEEKTRALKVSHWLFFERNDDDIPYIGEIQNIFLLSLWIEKPTRTQVAWLYKRSCDGMMDNVSRALDRFNFIRGAVQSKIYDTDLECAASFYECLSRTCYKRGRLNNALLLTLSGCFSSHWQAALICFSAALEAILTYSKTNVARRLALAYACLVESDVDKRVSAFREFENIYSTRSEIMHGRSYDFVGQDPIFFLGQCQLVLRKLWRVVCSCPELMNKLEGSDEERESYFQIKFGDCYETLAKRCPRQKA